MSATQELLRFGVFELNLTTEELRKSAIVTKLPPQPFQLLALLASHAGQIVTRDTIQRQLWGEVTEIDSEHGMRQCINQIRTALGDDSETPIYIETIPRQGYRFLAKVVSQTVLAPGPRVVESSSSGIVSDIASRVLARIAASSAAAPTGTTAAPAATATTPAPPLESAAARESSRRGTRVRLAAAFVVLLVLVTGGLFWRARKATALTEKDTVVIAEFDNQTGDPVFNGTLRDGLAAQLEQSPFLNILSDQRIARTMALMTQPKYARLTPELAREVCIRTESTATLEGSIVKLGEDYVLGLKAMNCLTGDEIATEQFTVNNKEVILPALGNAASLMRHKLGESNASVRKFDAPMQDVTTASLDALQAYSLGHQAYTSKDNWVAAVPFFRRAISLDPNFAMAYAGLGRSYFNRGEPMLAAENARKAYELRDRVSEREKLYIASQYEQIGTGNLEAARDIYELWAQMYPRDEIPAFNLANIYQTLGDYEKALETAQRGLRLDPSSARSYGEVVGGYTSLNRLNEAIATAQEARAHNLDDDPFIHFILYFVHFLQHDAGAAQREVDSLLGKPGWEDLILFTESNTAAYAGRMSESRKLTQMAVESALHADEKETAAGYEVSASVVEALMGNMALARQRAQAGLALSNGKDAQGLAAIAVALAGDASLAMGLADDLNQRFPEDTIVQSEYLPMIRAGVSLGSGDPTRDAEKGISALTAASPHELGTIAQSVGFGLSPVYLRGNAYLAARQGAAAAAEFQKVQDYSGVVANQPIGALAHLGLGRAFVLSGETGKAKTAYQDFLTLWKDADPDVPIFKQAKAEYAKLQ